MQHRELPHNPTITLDICSIQRLYPHSTIFDLRSISVDSVCQINKTKTISELRTYEFFESSLLPIQSPFIDPIYPFALDSHQRYQAFLLTPFDLFQWCGYDSNAELFETYMVQMDDVGDYLDVDDDSEALVDSDIDTAALPLIKIAACSLFSSAAMDDVAVSFDPDPSDDTVSFLHARLRTPSVTVSDAHLPVKKKQRRHKKKKTKRSFSDFTIGFDPEDSEIL